MKTDRRMIAWAIAMIPLMIGATIGQYILMHVAPTEPGTLERIGVLLAILGSPVIGCGVGVLIGNAYLRGGK